MTHLLRYKNEQIKYKSIDANRSFNSNLLEESKKEKKHYKELFGSSKTEKGTLPSFSSQSTFNPVSNRNKYPKFKVAKPEFYQDTNNQSSDKENYEGKTLPLFSSK